LSAVYMISEKASDVIIDKYRQALQSGG